MNQKVHFDDFIRQVALESGFDVDTARAYVEALFETIVEENSKGEPVKIQKFGSFQLRAYKAKRGINPQTLNKVHCCKKAQSQIIKFLITAVKH